MQPQAEIIPAANDKIQIKSPYNADFVAALKDEIPANSRSWNGMQKVWEIEAAEAEAAVEIASRFYQILDRRTMNSAAIDDAKIDAELANIQTNQEFIRTHTAAVEQIIDALEQAVKGYSYTSKSSVKYSIATDAALLRHSLSNATQPAAELVEIQVRGLAAARRLLSSQKSPRNWPNGAIEAWKSI